MIGSTAYTQNLLFFFPAMVSTTVSVGLIAAAPLILIFGFVLGSKIIEGRSYTSTLGVTRVLKELEILPLQQDWERALATLSMSLGSKLVNLTVTDEGAVTFSTKHTAVDDDGNAEKKSKYLFLDYSGCFSETDMLL